MNARHFPSLLLAATIGTVLLLEPFAQNSMPSSSPVLIEANRTPFKAIPDTGCDDIFDDDFKDLLNVIKAFQLDEPYDESICFCGYYADQVGSKLVERIAKGEVTREQVDRFCPYDLIQF
jgi:hypothetical protein